VLPTLFSYKRWKLEQKNIVVDDLVMLKYPGQFKDDYCMAKVTKADPDEDGLVRKVTVAFKKRNPRESSTIYKYKPLISEEVAVHRLHKLHLADEPALLGDHGVVVDGGQGDDHVGVEGHDVGVGSVQGNTKLVAKQAVGYDIESAPSDVQVQADQAKSE